MEIKSQALKANLEETRVHVEIEDQYQVIISIFDKYQGLQSALTTLLTELSNPMRNWNFIVSEARKYAFDHLHIIIAHADASKAIERFLLIFFDAIEATPGQPVQDEAADQFLSFLQKVIRQSHRHSDGLVTMIDALIQRILCADDVTLLLFAKSYYRFNRIVRDLLRHPQFKAVNPHAMNALLLRYHKISYKNWLTESNPLTWFEAEIEEERLPDGVKTLFAPISHHSIRDALNRVETLASHFEKNESVSTQAPLHGASTELIHELINLPEYNDIVEQYKSMPAKLLKAGSSSRQGNHWKVLFLFYTLSIPGLSMIHKNTFQDINNTLRWLINVENTPYIQQLIRQTFTILKLQSTRFPETTLNSILNMGSSVYKTGNTALIHFFLECVIDSGFQLPVVQSVGRDWQLKDNRAHIKNLRVWFNLIALNPARSTRLISHLIIYLSLYGVLIKDTDLFPREVTTLLNSPIEPVYNLVKQLTRLLPVYYNEIGAEGAIRDTSTELDELCHRKDRLIHFYRKRIHVESSNRIIAMTEGILSYWLTKDMNQLADYIPPDLMGSMPSANPYERPLAQSILKPHDTSSPEIDALIQQPYDPSSPVPPTTNSESFNMSLADNSFQINAHGLRPTTTNESLDMAMPINSFQIKTSGRFIDGVHSDLSYLERHGFKIPEDLLNTSGKELQELIDQNPSPHVTATDHRRVMLIITLYKLLYQKYSPAFTEINKYLKLINTADIPHMDLLQEALKEQTKPDAKVKWKLQKLLNYLGLLKKELLSEKQYDAREDIFKKRHFTTDIPSLYGSYHEHKFDALGLTYRLESLVNPLFEALVEELDLTIITKVTVHKIRNRLQMFYTALKLDGISSSEYEFQMELLTHSLGVQGFTFTQYLDIFQAINKAVKNIINDYFHTTHQKNLARIVATVPHSALLEKYQQSQSTFDMTHQVAEIFFRDRMASALGLQQLDRLLTKIQTILSQQAQGLPQAHLQKLLMYDPKRIITAMHQPKTWIMGAMDLGNKGNNLVTLCACGLPVPPGFIITTEAFRYRELIDYYQPARYNFREQIRRELKTLEKAAGKRFGDPSNPLLLSVRSGSVISQPGMMDTFIDVGMNEEIAHGLAKKTGNPWLAWDNYRRFLQCFGMAKGIKRDAFDAIISDFKETLQIPLKKDFSGEQMMQIALAYKEKIIDAGFSTSENPFNQLLNAIKMVFDSWNAPRAMAYRRIIGLSEDWGTSVTVQQMVFGNRSEDAGTGVVLTHDPRSPREQISLWGDFTRGSQGEDVVAGLVNTFPISINQQEREMRNTDTTLESHFPKIYKELQLWADELVGKRGWSPQEIEFTFEGPEMDNLYILQTRDLGIRERKTRPKFRSDAMEAAFSGHRYLGNGIGVSGGAMTGRLVFTLEEIQRWRKLEPDTPLIIVRNDTVPDDIREIHAADGLLTARGGMTSHASIVAYRLDKTCVVGYRSMVCDETIKKCNIDSVTLSSGDFLSIDGHEGSVFKGELPIVST